MPRLNRRKGTTPCDAHGNRCKLGGGGSYVSAYCHPVPPRPCVLHGTDCTLGGGRIRRTPRCEPVIRPNLAELDPELARQARVKARVVRGRISGEPVSPEEAAELVDAEQRARAADAEAERRRWERLSCAEIDAELAVCWGGFTTRREGEQAELAKIVAEAKERLLSARELRRAEEAAAEAAHLAADAEAMVARMLEPPQEPPTDPAVSLPPENVTELAAARRRRRRPRARAWSVNTMDDDGYNDPMRD